MIDVFCQQVNLRKPLWPRARHCWWTRAAGGGYRKWVLSSPGPMAVRLGRAAAGRGRQLLARVFAPDITRCEHAAVACTLLLRASKSGVGLIDG